jgi:hypothetical protein
MTIVYIRTKLYTPKFGGSLFIINRAKPNKQFRTVAMLFYMLQKSYLNESWIFFQSPFIILQL